MLKRVLVANRGEIALRVIRSLKEIGVESVAVYAQADKESLHVKYADKALCIGKGNLRETYLNKGEIITAAKVAKADAIHPGYGFLSENAEFAKLVNAYGIVFIGPSPETISRMGDKIAAVKTALEADVPVIPGSHGAVESDQEVMRIASEIGYPLIIKAAAGGGGKGMRIVREEAELAENLHLARNEAQNFFGNDSVYVERFIEVGRHVEVQILADGYGNAVSVGERECSIQRRHQKLIEESPAPFLPQQVRQKMFDSAVRLAKQTDYIGAGTVEYIVDEQNRFYFIEMNTRIQVEHPVTELCSDIDLVRHQILVAGGAKLPFTQQEVLHEGHSIECRINAEDPDKGFIPSPGTITHLILPGGPGVRIDSHIYPGYTIPHLYDSLVAKIIVHAENRDVAIARMKRALHEFKVEGIETTIPLHLKILDNERFKQGKYNTDFISREKILAQ
ncbi:acetyl-CoA carboxylase biotin carboxylase subunit [Chitinispirillales bacterium ANBcel5]|uniref:acetyl-CoA carboxylase biotin carboxylase subunit n=1 Tax=Cellulosispirillum alkaliphilum TaxID=3039283 RepID=UPI002A4F6A55|nr:acetyl-CoA carboxylase biotin carboxylase subunit [Chitinispirillales bacterium ANBcel5]